MSNILNKCEYMYIHAKWPEDFEEEDIVSTADQLSHYYLLSKRLEKVIEKQEQRIIELEKKNG